MSRPVPAFADIASDYQRLREKAEVLPSWEGAIDRAAQYAIRNKARYRRVSQRTGVPWAWIAAVHWRESSGSFTKHLHNGDSLKKRTWRVPAGRPRTGEGPFTWEESALDALQMKGFRGQSINWTPERVLYEAERYNGFGYRLYHPKVKSPYLWSGTRVYTRGKYVADGQFSASAKDQQIGFWPLYQRILELDRVTRIEEGSRKVRFTTRVVQAVKAFFGAIASLFTLDSLGVLREIFDMGNLLDPKTLIILLLAGAVVWAVANTIKEMCVEDIRNGEWEAPPEDDPEPEFDLEDTAQSGPLSEGWNDDSDAD